MARTTWADRMEGKMSKACCAPGSSAYTTLREDDRRNRSTKSRACETGTRVSTLPCRTKKSGASGVTRSRGEAASKSSGCSAQVVCMTLGARKRSRISSAALCPVEPARS